MDIYLRQSWTDKRLNLSRFGINYTVTLNGEDLMEKIWKPDLFFRWECCLFTCSPSALSDVAVSAAACFEWQDRVQVRPHESLITRNKNAVIGMLSACSMRARRTVPIPIAGICGSKIRLRLATSGVSSCSSWSGAMLTAMPLYIY